MYKIERLSDEIINEIAAGEQYTIVSTNREKVQLFSLKEQPTTKHYESNK